MDEASLQYLVYGLLLIVAISWLRYNSRRQRTLEQERNAAVVMACCQHLRDSGFYPDYWTLLADQQTLFALSRSTPGVAAAIEDGQVEITPIRLIIAGQMHHLSETVVKSHGGSAGFGFGNVFVGSGGSATTVESVHKASWLQLKVRDYDTPERWFQFLSPEVGQLFLDRVNLLLEEHAHSRG